MTPKSYQAMAEKRITGSPVAKDCTLAFLAGGTLCAVAQVIIDWAGKQGLDEQNARLVGSLSLIFLSVALTALCVYDNIAKHVGAGVIVPITGFANSMSSPAMEFKSEGFVLGMAAKMFNIAGPVIVYGTVASVIYGVIYWVLSIL
ncbi:MAG: SpoVA/SpoVAEb family sporulation membrane protein [Clostridia bacterium]|nr:SpoVA/SpoVAEb family sporulation membrane protein [Clostridia bacterium]